MSQAVYLLLVERDEIAREIIEYTLRMIGHRVIAVKSLEEGKEQFMNDPKNCIAVITGMKMLKDDDGIELCKQLRRISPLLRIFLVSSSDGGKGNEEFVRDHFTDKLMKPFAPVALGDMLRRHGIFPDVWRFRG